MVIKQLDWNTYDVFAGDTGWDNWIRVRVNNNDVERISGFALSKHFKEILKKKLVG